MVKKKTILFVISSLQLGGGAEKVLSLIANNFNPQKYDIKIITFYNKDKTYVINENIKIIQLNEYYSNSIFKNVFKLFKRASMISKVSKQYNVNSTIAFMEAANFPAVFSKILGNKSKIIVSIHVDPHMISYKLRILWGVFYKYFADNIVVVANEMKRYFSKRNYKNVVCIYNPVNLKEINKLKIGKLHEKELSGSDFVINIGRLEEQKNHKRLIEIFKDLGNDNLKLVIIGQGSLKKDLDELIKKYKLDNRVYLLGVKENVYKYLSRAKLFLFTSDYEGFGIVLIEAMACGLPIISNDCDVGPREIIQNNNYGLLIQNNNKVKFIKQINSLINNDELYKKYSKLSLKRARDFDIKQIIKKWEKLI